MKDKSMLHKEPKVKYSVEDLSSVSSNKKSKLLTAEKGPKDGLKKQHGNIGKKFTEERRKKISLSNKGKLRSEETKKRMSLAKIGKPQPERTKIKKKLIKFKKRQSKPVIIGVNFFTSISSAAKFHNLSRCAVAYRCMSENFTGWNFANEDVIKNKIKEEDSV